MLLTVAEARRITVPIVYALVDARGLFYVGQTKRADQRFDQHVRGLTPNRGLRGRVKAAGDSLRVQVLHWDPPNLLAVESAEIASRPGLVNLVGREGFSYFARRSELKPWQAKGQTPSPSEWASRKTGDSKNPQLASALARMTDAHRCGYELSLLAGFHPIIQKRFAKWLGETRGRMLECLNSHVEVSANGRQPA